MPCELHLWDHRETTCEIKNNNTIHLMFALPKILRFTIEARQLLRGNLWPKLHSVAPKERLQLVIGVTWCYYPMISQWFFQQNNLHGFTSLGTSCPLLLMNSRWCSHFCSFAACLWGESFPQPRQTNVIWSSKDGFLVGFPWQYNSSMRLFSLGRDNSKLANLPRRCSDIYALMTVAAHKLLWIHVISISCNVILYLSCVDLWLWSWWCIAWHSFCNIFSSHEKDARFSRPWAPGQ